MEMNNSLGSWAFILGVLIAIIAGLAASSMGSEIMGYMAIVLVVLGLAVGFLNISAKEVNNFLIAAIALVAVGAANLTSIPWIGSYLASMVLYISAFVAPAALIVALKAIYSTARTPTV